MAEQSLKDKTVKGVGWSAVDNVSSYIVSFIISIILARLLTPDDYGLIGIIAIFTAVCDTVINGGFGIALIRKSNASEEDYNTVFIINLVMSLFLYAVIFLCSPFIADFFGRQELVELTRVSSISMIIGALALVQHMKLIKKIDFRTQTIITITSSVASGAVGITMAFLDFGVWALVAQGLTNRILKTFLLWMHNKWIPNLKFSINSFKELFGFGWKLLASGLLDTVWKQLSQVVVGRYYNPATLGQYTRAKGFSELLSTNLTGVVEKVTLPVLSNIQDEKERMVSIYRRVIKTTMFISTISIFFLGAVSTPLLYCLIGPQWYEASLYLPLICIASSLYPLHALNLNMLHIQGRSDLFLGLEIAKKIVGLAPLFVGAFVGIMPMLYANIITGIISFFLNSHYSGRFIGYSSLNQLKDVSLSYGIALLIAVPTYFFKFLPLSYWLILPIQVLFGIAMFFIIVRIFNVKEYNEVKLLLLPYINKIFNKKQRD